MADDLEDLRARVAAARDRLTHDVDFAQKVELRLNDLARIVEGSLARQSAELETAQQRIAALDEDLARALSRAEQAAGDAAQADRLGKENGDLRTMVMTLLEVIEGRQKSSLASVMLKLEENVSALVLAPQPQPVSAAPETAVEEPAAAAPAEDAAEDMPADMPDDIPADMPAAASPPDTSLPETVSPEAVSVDEPPADEAVWETPLGDGGPEAEPEPVADGEIELEMEPEAEPGPMEDAIKETDPMEDLSEIALYDASNEVVEPAKT